MFSFFRKRRNVATAPQPAHTGQDGIAEDLWKRVEANLPFLDFLSAADRMRLRRCAQAFLQEKEFHGANGFELSDEVMLSIALQASLLVLNIGLQAYRGWVGIVVYPGEIMIARQEMDEDGIVHEYDDTVLGEAWEDGPVLLAWEASEEEEGPPDTAPPNVVIHEFAHKLDMLEGGADGCPALHREMNRARWAEVFQTAYDAFCDQLDAGTPGTVLDPYAAEHPAEFFAVTSEAFFEAPQQLAEAFPEVYEQLALFYRLDPLAGLQGFTCCAAPV